MQASLYNNPMFAQGLAGLVQSFIGDPGQEAQNQLLASEALLNNQTAQYREAIGDTGLNGDMASMMIRALQAGPDYARVAPGIGQAAIGFQQAGYGGIGEMIAQQLAAVAPQQAPAAPAPQAAAAPRPVAHTAPSDRNGLPLIAPSGGGVPQGLAMEQIALTQARQAIAEGRDPALVAQRLAQIGIDPGRL